MVRNTFEGLCACPLRVKFSTEIPAQTPDGQSEDDPNWIMLSKDEKGLDA